MGQQTLTVGQIGQPIEIGAGTRVTASGSGYVQYAAGTLQQALNGVLTWVNWPNGTSTGFADTLRRCCIRGVASGTLTLSWDESKKDEGSEGAYWQEAVPSFTTDPSGNVTGLAGPNGPFSPLPPESKNTFVLMIGADHSDGQKWGVQDDGVTLTTSGNGYMKMLQDGGLKPYLATTTSPDVAHSPAASTGMTWSNLAKLQDRGIEMLSHAHEHKQRWDRLNTGIFIGYNGANATATVQISTTQIILTAGTDSLTITRSSLATLQDVLNAINAVSGWDAHFMDSAAMVGTEPQYNLLPINGARNTKGSGSGDNRYFCCGGGLHVWCGNTGAYAQVPEHVRFRIRTNGWLEITIDGVVQWYGNLSSAPNNTFSTLAATLNTALNSFGVYCAVADNGQSDAGGSSFLTYMRGDELTSSLVTLGNRVASPGNIAILPTVIEAGLTQDYIRERQYQRSIDAAAAQGVRLTGFAEPGNYWFPWHQKGFNKFKAYRGTIYSRFAVQHPITYPLAALNTPFFVRSNCIVSGGYSTPAHLTALADAMADSPGHACCLLWHKLSTTGAGGNQGYELGNIVSLEDQDAANVAAFLARLKPYIASGQVTPAKLGDVADVVGMGREPFNLIFNANFKNNAAAPITINTTNNASSIPGWVANMSNTAGATVTIRDDGMIALYSPTVADFTLKQSVILDRNVDWEYGLDVREAALTAGNGATFNIVRTMGRPLYGNDSDVNFSAGGNLAQVSPGQESATTTLATGVGGIMGRLSLNKASTGFDAARIVGITGPFTITAATNDTISLQINGINPGAALTLTPGVTTAVQVVNQILAWMQSDSVFSTYPEFWQIARARRAGRTSPVVILGELQNIFKLVVTGTSILTIFGGVSTGAGHVADGNAGPDMDAGLFSVLATIAVNFQGSIVIGRPYIKRMEMM